jgi:hypothetical protein
MIPEWLIRQRMKRPERGLFPPPESRELLERCALALGVKPGSDH